MPLSIVEYFPVLAVPVASSAVGRVAGVAQVIVRLLADRLPEVLPVPEPPVGQEKLLEGPAERQSVGGTSRTRGPAWERKQQSRAFQNICQRQR